MYKQNPQLFSPNMQLFYSPDAGQETIILDAEQSKHCARVLRMRPGDALLLTDGKGAWHRCTILESDPKACLLQVTERKQCNKESLPKLHVAVAPTKSSDRFEWFIEKATECGIEKITPIICERSERSSIKHQRLEKIMISAMKQSQRPWLPSLQHPEYLTSVLSTVEPPTAYIAWCGYTGKHLFQQIYSPGEDALILIGPEGDFTDQEITLALKAGCRPISLGDYRLRTETAALASCIQFNTLNQLI